MIFGQDRRELRRMYAQAWQKHLQGEPLSPLEAQIAAVVTDHPEYHYAVTSADLDRDFTPEGGRSNPFLHMGLHLGLREQVATDRPQGIAAIYRDVRARLGSEHEAEHRMIDCLAEALWEAQRQGQAPDEHRYLERLRRL
jgi:hypothetical protein